MTKPASAVSTFEMTVDLNVLEHLGISGAVRDQFMAALMERNRKRYEEDSGAPGVVRKHAAAAVDGEVALTAPAPKAGKPSRAVNAKRASTQGTSR